MSKQNSQRISNPYAEAYCTLMMAETKTKSRRMSVTCLTLTCLLLKYPQIVGFLKNPLLTTTQKKEALAKYGSEGTGKNLPFSSLSEDLKKKEEKE